VIEVEWSREKGVKTGHATTFSVIKRREKISGKTIGVRAETGMSLLEGKGRPFGKTRIANQRCISEKNGPVRKKRFREA